MPFMFSFVELAENKNFITFISVPKDFIKLSAPFVNKETSLS